MAAVSSPPRPGPAGFRTKLLVAMMLVVSAVIALGLYFAERNLTTGVERDLEREFQAELATLNHQQEIRHAALVERCRALVRKPRIHAALEDHALDGPSHAGHEVVTIRERHHMVLDAREQLLRLLRRPICRGAWQNQ